MKRRSVVVAHEARADLRNIYFWVRGNASALTARRYVGRIRRHLETLADVAERGNDHATFRKGLRSIGFEGRVQILFEVTATEARIIRIFYGGQNWRDYLPLLTKG